MSSLEIAELLESRHDNVSRLLSGLLDEVLQKGIKSKRCMSVGFREG